MLQNLLGAPGARRWAMRGPDARPAVGRGRYAPAKAAIEWVAALAMLAAVGPLIGLLIVLVRLSSPGPALYRQQRQGRDGRLYWICKLRTMVHNCEQATGPAWSSTTDPRVTRLGRFLRETHLDELPQLWHVLQGRMSLIGPRPERPEIAGRLAGVLPRYAERLRVRPGLTGLAQIRQPPDASQADVRRKLAYDLYYIENLSFTLDLRIAVSTVFYLLGVLTHALCDRLIRTCGRAAERYLDSIELTEAASCPVPVVSGLDEESDVAPAP